MVDIIYGTSSLSSFIAGYAIHRCGDHAAQCHLAYALFTFVTIGCMAYAASYEYTYLAEYVILEHDMHEAKHMHGTWP